MATPIIESVADRYDEDRAEDLEKSLLDIFDRAFDALEKVTREER